MKLPSAILKRSLSFFLLVLFLMPSILAAAEPSTPKAVGAQDLFKIMGRIARWIFTFLIVVAVIAGVIAAYQYITAGGDPEKLETARTNIIYALIALAVGVLAFSIPLIVCNVLGSDVIDPKECNPFYFGGGAVPPYPYEFKDYQ